MFPGGGVEQGESYEQAVVKETLEEAGLAITNIRQLSEVPIVEEIFSRREGQEGYTHTSSIYYTAEYTHEDLSLFNIEGDGANVHWMSRGDATDLVNEVRQNVMIDSYKSYEPMLFGDN